MLNRGLIFWPLVLIFLLLVFRWLNSSSNKNASSFPGRLNVKFGEVLVNAQLAQSTLEKEKGLSGREGLGENEGLLFIFDQPGFQPFWMKEMKFAIDIIWIGTDRKVVDITENISPQTYPQTFTSKVPAQYVLEVTAGWSKTNQIKEGLVVSFLP